MGGAEEIAISAEGSEEIEACVTSMGVVMELVVALMEVVVATSDGRIAMLSPIATPSDAPLMGSESPWRVLHAHRSASLRSQAGLATAQGRSAERERPRHTQEGCPRGSQYLPVTCAQSHECNPCAWMPWPRTQASPT